MDLKDIKAIIDLMKKNSISEFELERQDFKIKLKRATGTPARKASLRKCYLPAGGGSGRPAPRFPHCAAPAARADGTEIKSPMIGTFIALLRPKPPTTSKSAPK